MTSIAIFTHILIPTDGSALAYKAIQSGIAFAKQIGAKVTGYHALPKPYGGEIKDDLDREIRARYDQRLHEQAAINLEVIGDEAKRQQVQCDLLVNLPPSAYEGIVKAAKDRKCDLIFMASHGRTGIPVEILGSVAQKVVAMATIPVLIYRKP